MGNRRVSEVTEERRVDGVGGVGLLFERIILEQQRVFLCGFLLFLEVDWMGLVLRKGGGLGVI